MSLTSPLIDQAIAQVCAFPSPFLGILSAMGILHQLANPTVSGLLKITGPNLFAPYFSASTLIIKQFGRLFSA